MTMASISPLVSVIITTKNNEATLDACLRSIKKQSYSNIELIVVDNNSSDKTKNIAHNYTELVYDKGPERSAQRNYAVQKASGKYILVVDSDMELAIEVVSDCIVEIDDATQAIIIPEESFGKGFWSECKALERSFYVGIDWIEAPRFFTKSLYEKVGGYDENMVGGEDWDLCSRIRQQTNVGRIKSYIRHNEGHLKLSEIIQSRKYYARGFKQHYDKPKVDGQKSGIVQAVSVFKLLLSRPRKLFKKPTIGGGVLITKFLEFGTIAYFMYIKRPTRMDSGE